MAKVCAIHYTAVMKIYTKTGDTGETALFSGGRVSKNHLRVHAYGEVDELNSVLGCAKSFLNADSPLMTQLTRVQNELFSLGSVLATPVKNDYVKALSDAHILALEDEMDSMNKELPELTNFILPDGTQAASQFHLARTVCRRAERQCITLHQENPLSPWVLQYLNRLSDWLFVCARYENHQQGKTESIWKQ